MQASKQRFYFDAGRERAVVTITSGPCETGSQLAKVLLVEILQNFCNDPRLMDCGVDRMFDFVKIHHNGSNWVVTIEAIAPRQELQL